MGIDLGLYIEELQQTVTAAALNYDIWWVYKSKETRPQHLDTMNRYGLFFQTSIHAHFVALVVALYRLYEKRKDTVNVPTLLTHLRKNEVLGLPVLDKLDAIYGRAKPIWVKVGILRNEAFGHRALASSIDEAFRKAAVSPNELKQLLSLTKRLLNTMTHAWDRSYHAFNLGSRTDLLNMLEDLASLTRAEVRSYCNAFG